MLLDGRLPDMLDELPDERLPLLFDPLELPDERLP